LRPHLNPRFSEVSKPLREGLKELQQKRRDKTTRGKARYQPLGAAAELGDKSWWTAECESAFEQLKQFVKDAVDLAIPDAEGAASGKNPFHLWPDACNYGIGAGVFQSTPDDGAGETGLYADLGVPTWVTQQEITAAYSKAKAD
jgi:hypothetical protein